MKTVRFGLILLILLCLLFGPPAPLQAQEKAGSAARPSPQQVFTEIISPYKDMNDYIVRISAKVDMPTFRIPDFTAIIFFKKPDKFHVETKSFAPIPRQNGLFNPFQFDPDKNDITFLKTVQIDGAAADLYRVEPRGGKTQVRNFTVWVGKAPLRIIQAESLSFKGTKALVKLSYQTVEQGARKWLLPEKVSVHLEFPPGIKTPDGLMTKDNPMSGGMRRLDEISGEGNIKIAYSDWRVNTGIDDSMFKR